MGKKSFALLIIFIILISLYATNPTKSEFMEYAEAYIQKAMQDSGVTSNTFLDDIISIISGKAAEAVADIVFERNNYYLFSIYEVRGMDINYTYLGIFRQFIPISNFINTSIINERFNDIVNIFDSYEELDEDYYSALEVQIESHSDLIIEINSSSNIEAELFIFDEASFKLWENYMKGDKTIELKYSPDLHFVIRGDLEEIIQLERGKYYVVIENIDIGEVYPPINFKNDVFSYKIKISKKEI